MTEPSAARVAVYLDFDNIVISRYDQVNGRSSFQRDKAKGLEPARLTRLAVRLRRRGIRLALDASGAGLKAGLEAGAKRNDAV